MGEKLKEVEIKHRLTKVMNIIRLRKDWKPTHSSAEFGEEKIDYYDTDDKDEFFTIKHENVEVHCRSNSFYIEWKGKYDTFDMEKWLSEVEAIVLTKTLILDGKEYLLTEIGKG